ncbi:MAG: alpha-galactosidase [Clostridia bacterium]|nr:alpha-galactosidase [Clostridia bacterium]
MNFSFNYGDKSFTLEVKSGAVYQLENGVSVKVEERIYKKYDATEWVIYFENASDTPSQIFSDIWDCDTLLPLELPTPPRAGYLPKEGNVCVITMTGMVPGTYYWENDEISATEYGFNYEYLDKRPTKRFANVGGRSSEGMMPFFDVTAQGSGYITAIGWTGDWKTEFSKAENGVRMKSGLKETHFYLEAGERLRTTSTLVMKYSSTEDKHNKFRRLIKNCFSHKSNTCATREGIMATELWGGITSDEMIKRINEYKAHGIRFEDVWIDAGWYGQCTKCDEAFSGDWSMHTGDWEPNTQVHPDGLREVARAAKDAGMRLMLWLEPERAIVGTSIINAHPEWFIRLTDNNQAILNYGNPEARAYIIKLLCDYVEGLDLSCYRQDANAMLTDYFKKNDTENRRGISEIKHITGMYEVWDTILEKYPHLLIDNCSSGGRRIDIETLKRSIPFFRSDYQCNFNENSEVLQTHNANISCYLPYNGCTSKTKSDTYAIRSSYSASWGAAFYNTIFQSMDEEDFKWARLITDEYRSIRKYFSCDFYNHGSVKFDETSWAIWQYHDPDTQSGILMAFRRSESPFDAVNVTLKGVDCYNAFTFKSLDNGSSFDGSGTIRVSLPQKRSCTIFEYKQK